jgi:hypothetical protein
MQALEGGAASDEDEEGQAALPKQPVAHSYAFEQQELKKAFLQAAAEAESGEVADEGGVLRKKTGKRAAADAGDAGQDKEQQVNQVRAVLVTTPGQVRVCSASCFWKGAELRTTAC